MMLTVRITHLIYRDTNVAYKVTCNSHDGNLVSFIYATSTICLIFVKSVVLVLLTMTTVVIYFQDIFRPFGTN